MNNLLLRRLGLISAIVIVVGSIIFKNYLSSLKEPPRKKGDISVQTVQIKEVTNQLIDINHLITGRVQSKNRFDIYAEVTGMLLPGSKNFKEGTYFRKGETLLQIDSRDASLGLSALRSSFQSNLTMLLAEIKMDYGSAFQTWSIYTTGIDASKPIPNLPEVNSDDLKKFLISRNVYNSFYNIKSEEAKLAKYVIRAPFNGVVSNASINPNTIIRTGQNLGSFLDPIHFELEAGIPIAQINLVKIGMKIKCVSQELQDSWTGVISRISQNVDPTTQTAKIYINLSSEKLYEGMYLTADLNVSSKELGVKIPGNLLMKDQTIYVAEDGIIRKLNVKVIHNSQEDIVVQGIPDGTQVITQSLSGAIEGSKVETVN